LQARPHLAEKKDMQKHILSIFVLTAAVACGSPNQQQTAQSAGAPASETPAAGASAPAATMPATPGTGAQSQAAPGGSAPAAATPPAPVMMAMDVPSGTELVLKLETGVSSETAKPEQTVRATVLKPILVDGMVAIPEGASVRGTVISAEQSGRVKGRASIALRFHEVTVSKTAYKINTSRIAREAEATKGEDATKIGVGAGVGTAIGAIAGGKKGAAIGAAVGGGAGTGLVLATKGKEVSIPAGATLRTKIVEPVKITMTM
jgi:hypothetical protein